MTSRRPVAESRTPTIPTTRYDAPTTRDVIWIRLDTSAIAELFRFQDLITPRFAQGEPVSIEVERDWLAYTKAGARGAPEARPLRVTYVPPAYVNLPEFERFATTHLACMNADAGTGQLTAEMPVGSSRTG